MCFPKKYNKKNKNFKREFKNDILAIYNNILVIKEIYL